MSSQKFLTDLANPIVNTSNPLSMYDRDDLPPTEKVIYYFDLLTKQKRRKNPNGMIYCAYKIGQVIEEEVKLPAQRSLCLNLLTPYYRVVVVRTYCIFDQGKDALIFNLKWITLARISKLSEQEFMEILEKVPEIYLRNFLSVEFEN